MPIGKFPNFASCVRANRGKVKDAEAYCAAIERRIKERRKRKRKK